MKDSLIVLLTQKKPSIEDPKEKDLYKVGVIGNILQMLKLPDGTVKVLVEGKSRCAVNNVRKFEDYLCADVVLSENQEMPEIEQNEFM